MVIGDGCRLDHNIIVKWLIHKLLRLKLNLLFIHLFAQVTLPTLVCWDHVYCYLSTVVLLTDYGKGCQIVEQIRQGFGCEKSTAD